MSRRKSVQVFSCLVICIVVGDSIIKWRGLGLPIKLPHMDFQRHMSWSSCMFNELMWNVIVRFVDIDGRADHYYSNVLFIFPQNSYSTPLRVFFYTLNFAETIW